MHFPKTALFTVLALALGFDLAGAAATVRAESALQQVRYEPFRDQRGYDERDRGRDTRGGPLWRPGQILPAQFLNRVVYDWEERGLMRPPNGHQWVRVGYQFILVRAQDRMISRILNFN